MPKRRKQLARADKLAAKAARQFERTIVMLQEEVAKLPDVELRDVLDHVADKLHQRNPEAYILWDSAT
jgi:hypothetical protein